MRRTAIKRKSRPKAGTSRIYGPPERIALVKSLPCAACGIVGYSENAHVLGNGGMGRKSDYQTVAPLCGPHPFHSRILVTAFPDQGHVGCHRLFDVHREEFTRQFPNFNAEQAAADTERKWLAVASRTRGEGAES